MVTRFQGRAGLLLVSGLLALGCAVSVGLWQLRSSSGGPEAHAVRSEREASGTDVRESSRHTPNASVRPQHVSRLALLRTKPEELPSKVIKALGHAPSGVNVSHAQRVPESVPGDYWVVPGRGFVCLVWLRGNASIANTVCGSNQQVKTHGIVGVSLREDKGPAGGERLIVGVAPDTARRVRIETPGWPVANSMVGGYGVFTRRDSVLDPPTRIVPTSPRNP